MPNNQDRRYSDPQADFRVLPLITRSAEPTFIACFNGGPENVILGVILQVPLFSLLSLLHSEIPQLFHLCSSLIFYLIRLIFPEARRKQE